MRALVYDLTSGEILRRFSGPKSAIDNQNLSPNEEILTENDVSEWPPELSNLEVDTENETFQYSVTLSEARSIRVNEVKDRAKKVLAETDWYVTREQETGEAIPQNVLDHRSKVRSQSDTFEQEINNLGDVETVLEYYYSFPDPPDQS